MKMTVPYAIKTIQENVPDHSLLDLLLKDSTWEAFIAKKESTEVNPGRITRYKELMSNDECKKTIAEIATGSHIFSIPDKKQISKFHAGKKRTVYTYREDEMLGLRLLSFTLHKLDHMFSESLYSFRSGYGVRDAITKLRSTKDINSMYGYKTDIHDYFNSIDVELLMADMRESIDDTLLVDTFDRMLTDKRAIFHGVIVEEQKGVMAGTPVSPFLANWYLRGIDDYFTKQNCIYMRYADDVLILANSIEELESLRTEFIRMIAEKKLEMNPKKEQFFKPGEKFNFLGFSISEHEVDISPVTVAKLKGKIRRSCRSIRRWMLMKNAPINGTIKRMITTYDQKFFGPHEAELTWARWFFPVITTDSSLHEIDSYLQEHLRYIATGKFNKKNYDAVPYELLKELGYRTLVHEYHGLLEQKKNQD